MAKLGAHTRFEDLTDHEVKIFSLISEEIDNLQLEDSKKKSRKR